MSASVAPPAAAPAGEAVLGKAYDVALMRRLWPFVRPHARLLLVWLPFTLLAVAFEMAQPYLVKVAIADHIAVGKLDGLATIAIVYLALVVLQAGASFGEQWAVQLLGQRAMHGLRLAIYDHVVSQRAGFFDRMPVGRLLTRMTNDIESVNEMFASGVITLATDALRMLVIAAIMFSLDPGFTVLTFTTIPLLILLVNQARRMMRSSFREIRVRLAAMNAFAQEHLSGIKVVQIFRRERAAAAEYGVINAGHRDAYLASIRADASMYALVEAIGVLAVALVAWWAVRDLGAQANTVATLGLVVAFLEYINKFFIPIRDLSAKYAVMQGAMAAIERISELLGTREPDAPSPAAATTSGPRGAAPIGDGPADVSSDGLRVISPADAPLVSFDHVEFSYGAEPIIRGVTIAVERGQTVAIVGATGSGKSTLIKLLTRLYEPTAGRITVGGEDIRALPVADLRRRVTVVSQDVALFSGTVANNIALGGVASGRTIERAEIERAVARVGLDRLLADRPEGLDSSVGERGGSFSAGEKQLLAFARALVRDPEILVLDEATAHVDPETESLIERGVAELMRGRTTLVIAHRLSTIRSADVIIVLDRGLVIERGTHGELVAAGGAYARLEATFRRAGSADASPA